MMEPYYQDETVTIYCAKCEDVLPHLSGVDLVFTSPPYNLGNTTGGGFPDKVLGHYRKSTGLSGRGGGGKWGGGELANGYGLHGDNMPHNEYVQWQHDVLRLCWAALSDAGAIFYNHKPRILAGNLVEPRDYVPPELLPLRQKIVWARSGGINFTPAFYVPMHEEILVIAKPGFRLRSKGASGVGDVWRFTQETKNPHPAPFPIQLPRQAIETTPAAVVLDPFMGSGTTVRAAKDLGRRAIGIEREERWCEYAARRLSQEVLAL